MTVRLVGKFDEDFLAELRNCRVVEVGDRADLIFVAAPGKGMLAKIRKLSLALNPEGAMWVIYPRAADNIREIDVINAGRNNDLKDVKVASFSLTHTGLKFVIPAARRQANPRPPA
jgi:hypothetical protein